MGVLKSQCATVRLQGSSGSQVVAGGFRFNKLGTFAWLAIAVRRGVLLPIAGHSAQLIVITELFQA
jgi:hypothetical protein